MTARNLIDFETAKVFGAASTPFVVWGTSLELALKIAAAAGAVIYIVIKIVYLVKQKGER